MFHNEIKDEEGMTMIDKNNDWRLMGQEYYLANKELIYTSYSKDISKHDHCEFCLTKFSANESDLHEGYCTLDMYRWICKGCFNDFENLFHWKVITKLE